MHLYVLERLKSGGYDEAMGFVVRAPNVRAARKIASENAGDEGAEVWLNTMMTSCDLLTHKGHGCVILRDFKTG